MLRWALEAELPIEVYGADWEGRIPAAVVKATHVPNHALPELYGRSRVVVADHWPDMAAHGFVSNRVFDALACGTPVITDPVAGLEAVVGAGVEVVEGPEALAKAFRALDHDPDRWRLASQGGRRVVVERHGLDRRATELVEILETHREAIPRLGGVLDRRRHNP
jgi:spore maturation protein CgeB